VTHQRPTTGLAAGELAQLLLDWGELAVERLDHRKRHLDPLAPGAGQLDRGQELAPLRALSNLSGTPEMPW
jgi:hypothetical protein